MVLEGSQVEMAVLGLMVSTALMASLVSASVVAARLLSSNTKALQLPMIQLSKCLAGLSALSSLLSVEEAQVELLSALQRSSEEDRVEGLASLSLNLS